MTDIAARAREWWDAGLPFVRATVVSTWGAAPLPVGSVMLVGPGMEVVGGVSGGCVEGDVLEVARELLASGGSRLLRYGVSDDDARAVGLSCGGDIEVAVERVEPDSGAAPPARRRTVAEPSQPASRGRGRLCSCRVNTTPLPSGRLSARAWPPWRSATSRTT